VSWRTWVVAAVCMPVAAMTAEGQAPGQGRPGARAMRRLDPQERTALPPARRQMLEQQIRRTFWRAAKQRLGFTEEQMRQLERTTQRFDMRRRELGQQERASRVALRSQMLADTAVNQAAIASSLDQLHEVQRRRLELQAEEQRELATFMTPLQRARFMAMQEQVRRRMQELVRARPDAGPDQGEAPAFPP
jgi:hypothetical protein